MLKAAIYARYSSSLQRPTSIEDQISLCRSAAPRFGCEVAEAHIYTDAEFSGATNQRPGYQALMKAAKSKQFDVIIAEAQDRLWRDIVCGATRKKRTERSRCFATLKYRSTLPPPEPN